jgi:hypothetical protein
MKIISTRVHGIIDYASGLLFIAMPWILNLNKLGNESFTFIGAGFFTLFISILTRYEYGILKRIPMSTHLFLDTLTALFLIVSPWLLDFNETVYLPHVILGVTELVAVLLSDGRSLKDDKFIDGRQIYHIASQTAEEGIRKKDTAY